MDPVSLTIAGERINYLHSYNVAVSVFSQPSAFTATIGKPGTAAELLTAFNPGDEFQMEIGGNVVQTGRIDRISAGQVVPTTVTLSGRDAIAPLFDSTFEVDCNLRGTYFQMVEQQLKAVGMGDRTLFADQNAMKAAVMGKTKVTVPKAPVMCQAPDAPLSTDPNDYDTVLVSNTVKARAGERRYDWIKRQIRKVNLYLWSMGAGDFALFQLNPYHPPSYVLNRRKGQRFNIESHEHERSALNRHSEITVQGRGGGGCDGRKRVTYTYVDEELKKLGISKPMVRTEDVKTVAEAKALARQYALKERRDSWKLSYKVSGHMITSPVPGLGLIPWVPDSVVTINDEDLGIYGNYYLSDVEFSRSGGNTSTTLRFMRLEDVETIAKDD